MTCSRKMTIIGACLSAIFVAGCNEQTRWAVGCTEGVCAAVNDEGEIRYFDLSQKQATGTGNLPSKPVAPVNIDCNTSGKGDACAVVDGAGHIWFGPARPGDPFVSGGFDVGG
jgi:hypothetical protein